MTLRQYHVLKEKPESVYSRAIQGWREIGVEGQVRTDDLLGTDTSALLSELPPHCAGENGFEPLFLGSEPSVLPLDDSQILLLRCRTGPTGS